MTTKIVINNISNHCNSRRKINQIKNINANDFENVD